MNKRKISDDQEKTIRRQIFYENVDPAKVCKDFGISMTTLRVICGGPVCPRVRKAYGY